MNVLALADDVTGALEVGALLDAPVFVDVDIEFGGSLIDRCVMDTETRHLDAAEASAKILRCVRGRQPDLIYKKTDSTLRGNIGAELAALSSAYPERQVIFFPAYPDMGRTVVKGELLVDGVPVHLSQFASDPQNPVATSAVAALFQGDAGVSIVEASSNADMARAIDAALYARPVPILAGPASVARCVGQFFGFRSSHSADLRLSARCLVVNGSLHPVAKEQVRRILRGTGWVVMDFESHGATPQSFARELARAVREKLEHEPFESVIVLGGDSAFALLAALNARVIKPIGEVAAGVPVARIGAWQLVTKAGGFGDADLLARLQRAAT